MIHLINDLLNVARIEEGKYIYNFQSIDIEKEINSLIEIYNKELIKKRIQLEFKKNKANLSLITGDKEKIRLVIQNLLENAIKYNKDGGKINILLEENESEIKFSIEDTGVGLPAGENKRIFDKFFRGSNVVKMETEGSGLGLFICKNIIESHGGKIWFKSEENKGTSVCFTLPIKKAGPV